MNVRSMTGFARVRRSGDLGEVTVTVKSVNHRALDVHLHVPFELEALEPSIRQAVRKSVSRGHVDVRVSYAPLHNTSGHALNRPLFEAYLEALRVSASDYGVEGTVDLNSALRIPGMLSPPRDEDAPAELETLVTDAVEEALKGFNQFREREGAGIASLMKDCCAAIESGAGQIASLREEVMPWLRSRLEERLAELLVNTSIDPQRLAQEAALLADRSDIAEEIGRLRVHATELHALLDKGGEAGKKLDFLLQEMNRETNTILSKTSGAGELGLKITALGLDAKSNVERIREQALNVE